MAVALDTLEYARRLRECGFSEQQAEGQARALAATMTDTLATKEDLKELATGIDRRFIGIDARFVHVDVRLDSLEKRLETSLEELERRFVLLLSEQGAHTSAQLADLERRVTLRLGGLLVAGIGALATVIKLL